MYEVGGRVGGVAASLVGVVECRETAETGLDVTIGGGKGHAQVGIKGSLTAEVVVGLVDGVGEVDGYDEDVDVAAMFVESRAAGGRLRITGADCEAIVDGLDPTGCDLGARLGVSWMVS